MRELPESFSDPLVDLNLAELGFPVVSVTETRYKHPLWDWIYACIILVGILQT
jgi:hypothetical protein